MPKYNVLLKTKSFMKADRRSFEQKLFTYTSRLSHGDPIGKLGKFVQYEINNFCLCRPGFHVTEISDSSPTVQIFVQVVHVPATGRLVG